MTSQTDTTLSSTLAHDPDQAVRELGQTIECMAFEWRDRLIALADGNRTATSARGMVELIFRVKRRITQVEAKHGCCPKA